MSYNWKKRKLLKIRDRRKMISSISSTQKKLYSEGKCIMCRSTIDDEIKLGKLYQTENFYVHYYCLLFACGIEQNGDDDSGIMGFLFSDIEKEMKRGRKLKCNYCKSNGATIGCANRTCSIKFHLPCGQKNDTLHLFFGCFSSYCFRHRSFQEQLPNENNNESTDCRICFNSTDAFPSCNSLRAPCCKNSWFHRDCLQRHALSSGYFFRCPLCNNTESFLKEMRNFGIFIPDQDASWELEENAFQELHQRHSVCDVQICKCPYDRKYNEDGSSWEIILCEICGSKGAHLFCGEMKWRNPTWECDECRQILSKDLFKTKSKALHKATRSNAKKRKRRDLLAVKKKKKTVTIEAKNTDNSQSVVKLSKEENDIEIDVESCECTEVSSKDSEEVVNVVDDSCEEETADQAGCSSWKNKTDRCDLNSENRTNSPSNYIYKRGDVMNMDTFKIELFQNSEYKSIFKITLKQQKQNHETKSNGQDILKTKVKAVDKAIKSNIRKRKRRHLPEIRRVKQILNIQGIDEFHSTVRLSKEGSDIEVNINNCKSSEREIASKDDVHSSDNKGDIDGCESERELAPKDGDDATVDEDQSNDNEIDIVDCESERELAPKDGDDATVDKDQSNDNKIDIDGCESEREIAPKDGNDATVDEDQSNDNEIDIDGCESERELAPKDGDDATVDKDQSNDNKIDIDGCESEREIAPKDGNDATVDEDQSNDSEVDIVDCESERELAPKDGDDATVDIDQSSDLIIVDCESIKRDIASKDDENIIVIDDDTDTEVDIEECGSIERELTDINDVIVDEDANIKSIDEAGCSNSEKSTSHFSFLSANETNPSNNYICKKLGTIYVHNAKTELFQNSKHDSIFEITLQQEPKQSEDTQSNNTGNFTSEFLNFYSQLISCNNDKKQPKCAISESDSEDSIIVID